MTLSDEYLQKDNTENEAQVSGDKSDSETQKQVQSTIPREVILVICVIAAVLILIIVWRAVLKHLRKKKVETESAEEKLTKINVWSVKYKERITKSRRTP